MLLEVPRRFIVEFVVNGVWSSVECLLRRPENDLERFRAKSLKIRLKRRKMGPVLGSKGRIYYLNIPCV